MTQVAYLLLAVPFAFGLLRLGTTGNDWRYVAVAVASTLGALVAQRSLGLTGASTMARFLGAVAASAVSAAIIAAVLGARNGLGIAMVSLGFAVCSAGGAVLYARSRNARSG